MRRIIKRIGITPPASTTVRAPEPVRQHVRPPNLKVVGINSNCHTCKNSWTIDRTTHATWRCPVAGYRALNDLGPTNCDVYERDYALYHSARGEAD